MNSGITMFQIVEKSDRIQWFPGDLVNQFKGWEGLATLMHFGP